MMIACWGLVYCVEAIGQVMGIPLIFVSIILAAAASSVPDTVISLRDARKGNYNDAVSNALESNIFDICIAHGLPLLIYTIMFGPVIMTDATTAHSVELRVWLFILTAVTVLIYLFSKRLTKTSGFIMLLLYGVFIVFVIGRALGWEAFEQFGNILNIQKWLM